ncbi:unnamed protein product [Porites lobata]|uniref:Reverse transcriptase/retrotransposon-derived protein RNase H-like domain-containing protein n=1 Tax=Porites lobata TaxID=104759 RepID=A0ABN8QMS7_9CNID|nr:unnamed protein product [Porites lobata]
MVDEKPASTRPFSVKIEQSSREMILVSLDKVLHRDNKSLIPLTSVEVDASDHGIKEHMGSMKARGQRSQSVKGTSHKVFSKDKRKVSRLMHRLYNESREGPRSEDQGTRRDIREHSGI